MDFRRELDGESTAKDGLFLTCDSIELSRRCALVYVSGIISVMVKFNGREIEDNLHNIDYWYKVKSIIENPQK